MFIEVLWTKWRTPRTWSNPFRMLLLCTGKYKWPLGLEKNKLPLFFFFFFLDFKARNDKPKSISLVYVHHHERHTAGMSPNSLCFSDCIVLLELLPWDFMDFTSQGVVSFCFFICLGVFHIWCCYSDYLVPFWKLILCSPKNCSTIEQIQDIWSI